MEIISFFDENGLENLSQENIIRNKCALKLLKNLENIDPYDFSNNISINLNTQWTEVRYSSEDLKKEFLLNFIKKIDITGIVEKEKWIHTLKSFPSESLFNLTKNFIDLMLEKDEDTIRTSINLKKFYIDTFNK